MINVNEIKKFIDFIANKEQSGTSYSVTQLNTMFKAANIDLFKLRYGLPEQYMPGKPFPLQGYELTQKMKDDLRSCKEVINIPVTNGIMMLPEDYVHKTDITFLKTINSCCGGLPVVTRREVEIMDDDKFSNRCSNSIKYPTLDYPICNFLKDSIRVEPKTITTLEFSYLRSPNEPVWGWTAPNGVEIYDASASTDFEWNAILFTDIAKLIISYMSINLRDNELAAAMSDYKLKGN